MMDEWECEDCPAVFPADQEEAYDKHCESHVKD
jgi:hypothetical protein